MNKPHKHAEVIKAWADGHEIQFLNFVTNEWSDVTNPTWRSDREYRVKQQKKKISVAVVICADRDGYISSASSVDHSEAEYVNFCKDVGYKIVASFTKEIEVENV